MGIERIIQVFIIQLGMGLFFLFFAYLILKRDKKKLNVLLSLFFIFVFLGVLCNVIYALLTDVLLITILHLICLFFLYSAPIFPVVFNLIVLKSEKVIDSKKQLMMIIFYFALVILVFLIPGAVTIEKSNNYVPIWSLPFYISLSAVLVACTAIPFIITSHQISQKFEGDPELKKKWSYYMYTEPFYYVNAVMIGLTNHLNDPTFRFIWNIFALFLFFMAYTTYYGVGKQIDK